MPNQPIIEQLSKAAGAEGNQADQNLSLEALVLLINTERLKTLQDKIKVELKELKDRQEKVRNLHELLRSINNSTDDKGKLDISKNDEIKDLIKKAKELGVNVKTDKSKYSKEERDRLVENIRITTEDYNVQNDMQLQAISRLTNERYETYQMARSILKPLHDDKQRKAREISGRG